MDTRKVSKGYDVIIVGASVSGCCAAILYAKRGLSVALIEKRQNIAFSKKLCTHYIQSSCRKVVSKLDIEETMTRNGAVPTTIQIATRWGWVDGADPSTDYGYNLRRETLDPILRRQAAQEEGVTLYLGVRFLKPLYEEQSVVGIVAQKGEADAFVLRATLVVGADGRNSAVVQTAGVPTQVWPNNRFSCFAVFEALPEEKVNRSRMWLLEPEVAYQFPNNGETTLIALMPTMDRLREFKTAREASFRSFVGRLEYGPTIADRLPITNYVMNVENDNLRRGNTPPGLTLIGDALLTSDPLFGLGISWGLLSANWLVDCTWQAVRDTPGEIDMAVYQFRKKHQAETSGHLKLISDISAARPLSWAQRTLFSAAARNRECAKALNDFLAADISAREFTSTSALLKSVAVNLRHSLSRGGSGEQKTRRAQMDLENNESNVA